MRKYRHCLIGLRAAKSKVKQYGVGVHVEGGCRDLDFSEKTNLRKSCRALFGGREEDMQNPKQNGRNVILLPWYEYSQFAGI
eukprot:5847930-Prymnesium_polylepis.1